MKGYIDELLEAGVIEKCDKSQYNSLCLLVPKKTEAGKDAGHQLVIDYRKLNNILETVVYLMPRIQDILCKYQGCDVFSMVNIHHTYYTIKLDKGSRHITTFSYEAGQWQFKFLPQGLKISPAVFQGHICNDLKELNSSKLYMDDIITGMDGVEQHLQELEHLFTRLEECRYKLKLSKCELLQKKVTFTELDISKDGVHITEDKLKHVDKLSPPKMVSDVKSLLGFTSFLHMHIPYYCEITGLIQDLVEGKKNADVTKEWTA